MRTVRELLASPRARVLAGLGAVALITAAAVSVVVLGGSDGSGERTPPRTLPTAGCPPPDCQPVSTLPGFGGDSSVQLVRSGAGAEQEYHIVVMTPDGKHLWESPTPVVLTYGTTRFQRDKLGHVFVPVRNGTGQAMVVLAARDGKVEDFGSASRRRFGTDSAVQAKDTDKDGALEIVTQSVGEVPDTDTGGLVEATYGWDGKDYRVKSCRRLVGESFTWITYPASTQGDCHNWPEQGATPR